MFNLPPPQDMETPFKVLTEYGRCTTVLHEAAFIESCMGVSQMKARSITCLTHYVSHAYDCGDSYIFRNMWLSSGGRMSLTAIQASEMSRTSI